MTAEPAGSAGRVGPPARGATPWLLIFGLALALRVGFAIDHAHHHPLADRPVIDEAAYERSALAIAAGDWLGDEVFFQEPLYPYWLASVYATWGIGADPADVLRRRTAARHLQALYGAGAAVLVGLVGARLFGRRAGIVAGLACATYKPLCYLPALFLKANLVVPLCALLAWLALALRGRDRGARGVLAWAAFGVLAGLGALLRGNFLLLCPVFVLLPLLRARGGIGRARARGARERARHGLARAAAVLGGIALCLAPVAARNLAVGGVLALTTSGAGTNVYGGNYLGNPYGRAGEAPWVRGVPEHEADDWRREAERRAGRALDPGEVSRYWLQETLASVRAQPLAHARILWRKLLLTLGAYEVPDNHHWEWDARFVSALRAPLPGYGVWGVLGLGGMLAFALRRRLGGREPADAAGAAEVAALYALYALTIVLTVTSARVRLALVPLLLPFAGHAVDLVLARVRPRAWAGPLAAAALIVHVPVLDAGERAEDLLKRDYNLAVYRLQEGRLDEAETIVRALAARRPGTVPVHLLEAELAARRAADLRAAGAPAGAIERELDRALALLRRVATSEDVAPRDRFRARKLAGAVQIETGAHDVAERRFREALAFDPDDRDVRAGLARALRTRAERTAGPERARALAECRDLLLGLQAEDPRPELDPLLADVEAALAAGG